MIKIYSTGCPKCSVLLKKFDKNNIKYQIVSDIDEIKSLNITTIPMVLLDNGNLIDFNEAIKWLKEQ